MIGIEQHIRFVTVRENIFVFAGADLGPVCNGAPGIVSAELIITYHTPEHPLVRRRNPHVLVDIQLGQRTDVDFEFLLGRDLLRQFPVQTVNSFNYNGLAVPEPGDALAVFFLAFNEIKCRQIYFPACQQIVHVLVEQPDIDGVQIFIIRLAVLVQGCLATLNKIIIGSHVQCVHTVDLQLNTKPARECGFPGG